jgi:hypothetical protein
MAIGSGLGTQVGVAAESTVGTYAAPTRFFRALSFNIKKRIDTVEVEGRAAGRPMNIDRVTTSTGASGQLKLQVPRAGFGIMIQHLLGGSVVPVQQGGSAAYLQTHLLTDNYGKALTMQNSIINTAGTAYPISGLGGKIMRAEFTISAKGVIECTLDLDFMDFTEAQSLATASYIATTNAELPFTFPQLAVKLGTYGSEASVTGVRSVSIVFERPMNADDSDYAGGSGKHSQLVWNGEYNVSGSFEIDLVTKADFVDRFIGQTSTALVVEAVGPIIASSFAETLRFKVPKIYFDGDVPAVDGPGVLQATVPFKGYHDTTNSIAIEYMSRDTTV